METETLFYMLKWSVIVLYTLIIFGIGESVGWKRRGGYEYVEKKKMWDYINTMQEQHRKTCSNYLERIRKHD